MQTFKNFLIIWFTVQLVLLSAIGNLNAVQGYTPSKETCEKTPPVIGLIMGGLFPINQFTFITSDWCWNHLEELE